MKTGTVTISIEEFDRLRQLEIDIKSKPKIILSDLSNIKQIEGALMPSYFHSHIIEVLYTTDESQREMLDKLTEWKLEMEQIVKRHKANAESMQCNFDIQNIRMEALANSRKARREYKEKKGLFERAIKTND